MGYKIYLEVLTIKRKFFVMGDFGSICLLIHINQKQETENAVYFKVGRSKYCSGIRKRFHSI